MLPLIFGIISATVFGIASVHLYGLEGLIRYGYIFWGLIFAGLIISFLDEANQCKACRWRAKLLLNDTFTALCEKRHCLS